MRRLRDRLRHGDPFWPAQLSVALAIALNIGLPQQITIGPRWVVPGVEAALLAALIAATPRRAGDVENPLRQRRLALTVVGIVSLTSVVSLALLVHYLINHGRADAHRLILSGIVLWATNVLLFAVWYWEIDRGGPVARSQDDEPLPDLQFPQMENPTLAPDNWRPGYLDYLYTSLTNATAFSPTDTMPLTQSAKIVMGIQSVAGLVTIGLVVALAVNRFA